MKEIFNRYKYILAVIFIVLLFFTAKSCENNKFNQLKGENKILKEQVEKAKDGTKVAESENSRLKDSIKKETAEKEAKIKDLQEKLIKSQNTITQLQISAEKTKEKVKNMTYKAVADTLNKIYKTDNAVADSSGVTLKGNLPNLVLSSVVDAETYKYLYAEKDNQLKVKDDILLIKDSQLKDSSILLISAEKKAETYKELSEIQSEFIKNLEKENKSLKRKSIFDKLIIGTAAGFLIYQAVR